MKPDTDKNPTDAMSSSYPPTNPNPGDRWGPYEFQAGCWWRLVTDERDREQVEDANGFLRLCSWLFWSFALACGAVIAWLFL